MSGLHTLLKVEPTHTLMLRAVEWLDWGRKLVFDISAGEDRFAVQFDDCREMRWRIYVHDSEDTETPIVDFTPGRDAHRSPAQMLTGRFGVTLVYGVMTVSPPADD